MDLTKLNARFAACPCGVKHECGIQDIQIGSGLVGRVGEILRKNHFPKKLLVIYDNNTIRAADGILNSLSGFELQFLNYENKRVATLDDAKRVEAYIDGGVGGVLAIGTGTVDDPARYACAQKNTPLCLFATAPSMDGFASYSAPLVDHNFKITYPAKCPEAIIGDTAILAKAPAELKSAGFGDMVAKYIAVIDWKVSHLISGESYCENVCALTKQAADDVMKIADRVLANDEESAGMIFRSLLLTGIAMSYTKTSRPGSGTEHIMAHFWECMELLEGKTPNYHGKDVGVATLIMLKYYKGLGKREHIRAHREENDWEKIYSVYGALSGEVKKLNTPDTITDGVDPRSLEENWQEIRAIIDSVPSYEEVYAAMKRAGCATTIEEIGKTKEFVDLSFAYHPYMRRRLSLRRLSNMIE
jgi:glycerol-1-phosphate dehydrogenase [NAD(P)+]